MSTSNQPRTRSELVAGLRVPRGQVPSLLSRLRRGDVLLRIGLCLLAALAMWGVTRGWAPPFPYYTGYTPPRDIVASLNFSTGELDGPENERRRQRARSQTVCLYQHDVQPLVELRNALKNSVFQLTHAASFAELNQQDPQAWKEFLRPTDDESGIAQNTEDLFTEFRAALADDGELVRFERALQIAFSDYERDGLLVKLAHALEDGSQTSILVHPVGREEFSTRLAVAQVRIGEATANLRERLKNGFQAAGLPGQYLDTLAQLTWNWINKRLPETLTLNELASERARQAAERAVEHATIGYKQGDRVAVAGKPLSPHDIEHLKAEHEAIQSQQSFGAKLRHTLAHLGMYMAMYVLCGAYLCYHERSLLRDTRQLATILMLVVAMVTLTRFAMAEPWHAEIVPIVLFGMAMAIAYQRELALLLSAAVALVITLSMGQRLGDFVILLAAASASILLVGRVRSRTKLIYVGAGAGLVTLLTTLGVGTMINQTPGWSGTGPTADLATWFQDSFALRLLAGAIWNGTCAVLAGVLMTGLLPFVEKIFDVQTDISLLELGDAAHPLLQELVRRAPGTYNHSINAASIAEAAAEAIGANGLLCRVGAYFHDIGKMLKPGYFVENQGAKGNRHESLMPAMSTLVIIAHVKDGADLARQHRLPRSIIDFIEQHHGTTLVEYFYNQAAQRSKEDPDAGEVDETSFRYPGPKPQSKETGVMMLADASESACRTLSDPSPARIENLVHGIVMARLMDGQFEDCTLTLRELAIIEDSLVKSLTAVYHSRVKYPNQQSA